MVAGRDIDASGLAIELDDDPPGHASITGWADDSSHENFKSRNKEFAQRLARLATATRREE